MANDRDNMLTGNPAIVARRLAEETVPPDMRGPHWQRNWDAMEAHCDKPVKLDKPHA